MDKLKTLLLHHGEKAAAVIFALLGLMAFTSAHWSADKRNPIELVDTTSKGKAQIEQNQWPAEETTEFKEIEDVEALVRDEGNKLTKADEFMIGAYNPSIIRVRAKNKAVDVLAPEDPIADAIVFALAMPPEEGEDSEDGEDDPENKDETEEKSDGEMSEEEQIAKLIAEKYGRRAGATGGPAGFGSSEAGEGGGAFSMGGPEGGGGALGSSMMMGAAGGAGGEGGYGSSSAYGSSSYGGSELMSTYGTGMLSVKKRVRVSAAVSVRMIFDLQKQRRILREALHLSSDYREAQQLIQFIDLVVERRRKQGPDAWDDWEKVSSEDLGEILKISFGIDQDIVSPAVTRNTITMPLPRRATGQWSPEEASHPRVENFELSPEEKKLINKWNERVTQRLAVEQQDQPEQVKSKGFSQFVQSSTDATSMMMGSGMYGGMMSAGYEGSSGSGNYESATNYDDFASSMGDGTKLTAEQRELLDETRATADHRLLLVRFMDFTVERGFAYQYRVRLEMKNPNYNQPIDGLADPSLGVEPTLFSDWSDPTSETFVPLPHRTYLTDVDGRSGMPEKVSLSIFTDTTETGTPVMGNLRSVLMGLPIAGTQNIELVDLTTEEVAPKEITLKTNEILSAAVDVGRVSSSVHPLLKTAIDATKGRPVPDQICVIDPDGGLRIRTVGEDGKQESFDRMFAKKILEEYDDWKKKDDPASNFFGPGEGGADGGGYGSSGGYGGSGMSFGSSSAGSYYGGAGGPGSQSGSNKSSRRNRR